MDQGEDKTEPLAPDQEWLRYCGPNWYGEQDENGIDLSLIRENLKRTPEERIRRADRARRQALKLLEHARQRDPNGL